MLPDHGKLRSPAEQGSARHVCELVSTTSGLQKGYEEEELFLPFLVDGLEPLNAIAAQGRRLVVSVVL